MSEVQPSEIIHAEALKLATDLEAWLLAKLAEVRVTKNLLLSESTGGNHDE